MEVGPDMIDRIFIDYLCDRGDYGYLMVMPGNKTMLIIPPKFLLVVWNELEISGAC
jgi:hypothetical protein